eukprot:CAMPEP_0172386806 /NCGR_PEP_ID=MMETSP1061-20121228/4262_1 /TAXON_ID=37318 /ORGANISM="Pseudo-nitzschia pungens, Strain cf. pungens" /LENGTH=32 /DNA_ID= /DNA_START= /DNA_END= /DNA_ORIENTATION=
MGKRRQPERFPVQIPCKSRERELSLFDNNSDG